MSKAILIIDKMPKSCSECVMWYDNGNDGGKMHCFLDDYVTDCSKKCPLKPMPERKKVDEIERVDDFMKSEIRVIAERVEAQIRLDTELLLATGYNSCLDEILGANE